ncbi:coagulation factor IX-like isoform X2 [Lineus longissimus]|uniref:coagulation factor IX-like isoform X2 n=1 Tax=Lineus longissimus TaxID=88925 RepID=UPI00315C8EE7
MNTRGFLLVFCASLLGILSGALAGTPSDVTKPCPLESLDAEFFITWGAWSPCNRKCKQQRSRKCKDSTVCQNMIQRERRKCYKPNCDDIDKRSKNRRKKSQTQSQKLYGQFVYDLMYSKWSDWSPCLRSCQKRRIRECDIPALCRDTVLIQVRRCFAGTKCAKSNYNADADTDVDTSDGGDEVTRKPTPPPDSQEKDEDYKTDTDYNEDYEEEGTATTVDQSGESLDKLEDRCGLRPSLPTLRIVGGRDARKGSWPWQVAIMTRWKEQYCGGTLVAPQWVLTAAHCVIRKGRKRRVILRVGEHDFGEYEGVEEDFRPGKDFVHPHYDLDTIDSDIALVKLKKPVKLGKNIDLACVPRDGDNLKTHTLCYTVGWGKMKNTHIYGTDVLQEAKVPLVGRRACQDAFEFKITVNQMCAGKKEGGIDTCSGDSGGPLLCKMKRNGRDRWFVYGVTSFGEGCGEKGKYGIYVRVTNFADWIRKTIADNS